MIKFTTTWTLEYIEEQNTFLDKGYDKKIDK